MKNKLLHIFTISILIISLFPTIAFANSSWNWFTDNPLTVLPYAIVLTLLVENIAIIKFGKVTKAKKAFLIIILANLFSFLIPYIALAGQLVPFNDGFSIMESVKSGPYYIVLPGYLFLTILIELPIVYSLLKENTLNRKSLMLSIVISNIITTLSVAVIERIMCVGQW